MAESTMLGYRATRAFRIYYMFIWECVQNAPVPVQLVQAVSQGGSKEAAKSS